VNSTIRALLSFGLVAVIASPAVAQSSVTAAEVQRLQDSIYDVSRDVAQLRSRDSALASRLESELDEARDEAVYLRVKLRKNEPTSRAEYLELRDRIDNIRSRARGDAVTTRTPVPAEPARTDRASGTVDRNADDDVPVGTEFDVRLQAALSSATAQPEDDFEVTTAPSCAAS
jgi:TolA-binding protein